MYRYKLTETIEHEQSPIETNIGLKLLWGEGEGEEEEEFSFLVCGKSRKWHQSELLTKGRGSSGNLAPRSTVPSPPHLQQRGIARDLVVAVIRDDILLVLEPFHLNIASPAILNVQ